MQAQASVTEARAFYKAALAAALTLDADSTDHLLDAEADAAWRTYDSSLHPVIRLDLILKNLAMLYPGAFAPGPVFQLPGWYDDDPWGVGFERPPRDEVAALFRKREAPKDVPSTMEAIREAWDIRPTPPASFASQLSPTSQIIVTGGQAMTAVGTALRSRPNHQVRSQVLLVSGSPAPRHVLGIAAALGREQGAPRMIPPISAAVDARQAAEKAGASTATLLVTSSDASDAELACARMLADSWNVRDRVEV